ncbi:MAG: 4Fe-4S dicluster domain-containing protein [Coriobacteriia bacterium]|nr:4Fe-4S dicluster domain-containing protein [Coriobacteriia bacterium]
MLDLSSISDENYERIATITSEAAVDLHDCYQCGKCSAGCPMAHEMDLLPRQVLRALQLGQYEQVLNAKTPWICATCMVCSARCPQEINIHGLMLAVRHAAKQQGLRPVAEPDIFDDIFISNVRLFGKSNETILAGRYNLASRHLMQDMSNVPRMAARKMVGPKVHTVKNRKAVRELVDRVLKRGEEQ